MLFKFSVCKQKGGKTVGWEIIFSLKFPGVWIRGVIDYILEADLDLSILKTLLFVKEKALCPLVTQVDFKILY